MTTEPSLLQSLSDFCESPARVLGLCVGILIFYMTV